MAKSGLGSFRIRPVTYYAVQQCVAVGHDIGKAEWRKGRTQREGVRIAICELEASNQEGHRQ